MKERVKRILSKWPALYTMTAKLYIKMKPSVVAEHVIGTKAREMEWATKHRSRSSDWKDTSGERGKDTWVQDYWESRYHKHRAALMEKITTYSPVTSLLEIGCNCGPNLYLVSKRFPGANILGIDINSSAVEKGKELLAAEHIANVHLSVGLADELERFPDKSIDVVVTDAILIYIGRDKIWKVMEDIVRVARKGVVLVERYYFGNDSGKNRLLGMRYKDLWLRDYDTLIKEFAPNAQIKVTRITRDIWPDAGWQENGAIVEVKFPLS